MTGCNFTELAEAAALLICIWFESWLGQTPILQEVFLFL
jgi:hypothetical protein